MMRKTILLSLIVALKVNGVCGQATGPYALDKVVTATGTGNPIISPVTPSQPNELAFFITGADYSGGWCGNSSQSYLTGMSTPWVFAAKGIQTRKASTKNLGIIRSIAKAMSGGSRTRCAFRA